MITKYKSLNLGVTFLETNNFRTIIFHVFLLNTTNFQTDLFDPLKLLLQVCETLSPHPHHIISVLLTISLLSRPVIN